MSKIDLTKLKNGESGMIVNIMGGNAFSEKVEALGIRNGIKIIKQSAQAWHGPITIQIGGTKVALGFSMAQKIIVEKD